MSFQSFYIMRKVNALFLIIFFEATLTNFNVVCLILCYAKKLMLYFLLFSLKHNNFFDIVLVIHLNQYLCDVFLSDISFSFLFLTIFYIYFWQFFLKRLYQRYNAEQLFLRPLFMVFNFCYLSFDINLFQYFSSIKPIITHFFILKKKN